MRQLLFAAHVALVLSIALSAPAPLRGQSLAEAARAAQDATARNKSNPSPRFTNMPWTGDLSNDREVLSFELTMPLIRQHLSLYATVIRTLLADPALHQRVFEAQIGTRTLKAMETAYANEPVLTAVLGNAGVTVHQYVITTAALAMVAGTMDNTLHPLLARRGTVPANVALVRANQSEINELVTPVEVLESQMFARHPPATAR